MQKISLQFRRAIKTTRNFIMDLKFGGLLGRTIQTRYADLGACKTASTDYAVLPYIFQSLIKPKDVLVDVGCGRGRVIHWWLSQGYENKIIGVELDAEVARYARKKLTKHKNIIIIEGNILDNIPDDGTIFFLYNPFHGRVMEQFRDRMSEMCRNGKNFILVYYNCKYLNVFENSAYWQIEKRDLPDVSTNQMPVAIIRPCLDE